MDLEEILGIYIDTDKDDLYNAPSEHTVNCSVRLEKSDVGFYFYDVQNPDTKFVKNHSLDTRPFPQYFFIDAFYINTEKVAIAATFENSLKLTTIVDANNSVMATAINKLTDEYLNTLNVIPKQFKVALHFKVIKNSNSRDSYYARFLADGAKSPEEYAKNFTNVSVNYKHLTSKQSAYYAFPHESAKRHIIYKDKKYQVLFLIEYLYGHKLSHAMSYKQIAAKLASFPSTDFGFRDVKYMRRLANIIKQHHFNIKHELPELKKILEPKTDLKRWSKYLA